MSAADRIRVQQFLRRAEGYLELSMPQHALEALDCMSDAGAYRGRTLTLRGCALRALERYADAIVPLNEAANLAPSDIHIWLALGWCHKRTQRLDLAIESLERAVEVAPDEALIHYNLACYWSLAHNKDRALEYLARALELSPDYRELIAGETDFDPLRSDADFQSLVGLGV